MQSGDGRRGWLAVAGAAAGVLALLAVAGGAMAGGIAPRDGMTADTPPAREPEPGPAPAPAPPLRIIRVVCTDHVCGNCDGKCHRDSGHVAVDKKGHCACTPTEGSELDQATREAYARKPPQ